MSRARDLADSADKDIAGTLTADGLSVDGGTIKLDGNYPVGTNNVALGDTALDSNVSGASNTAIGSGTLTANTASYNTAVGHNAMLTNTTGAENTVIGYRSGYSLTTGTGNTFVGTGVGMSAGYWITTGSKNTIIGGYDGNRGGLDIRTSSNNIVLSDGDGNPRLRINSAGQLEYKNPTGGDLLVRFENTSNTSGNIGLVTLLGSNAINTSSYQYIAGTSGGSDRMYVYGNGNVVNINNSYGALSDQKLKENITDSSSQWDDVKALRVRKYSMIEEQSDVPTKIGVIAQELEEAGMGGLVFESPDRQNEGETVKQVNYSVLYMKAIKALQEAMERIETLEAKVEALENA